MEKRMMIRKIAFTAFSFLFILQGILADTIPAGLLKQTYEFARKDTSRLLMDVYRKKGSEKESQPVMLFVFGGAFKTGTRDAAYYLPYFTALSEQGITVASIDYRLGLVDKKVTLFNTTAADDAINMAVEDLFSATRYLIDHAAELAIDTACIMMSGSSAGAITVLQADYYLSNRMPRSEMLPAGFRYKGVLSFAGGIFSHKGTPDYQTMPAPTFFFSWKQR
ncbi:MAG: alpha/beta hydrolase [Tannerellaceae bacterium]|nr:alpha/beta hydrolase [Tannerellaceae bacterium]